MSTSLTFRPCPPVPAELVSWLDQNYPEKCPDPKASKREIWMKAGERRLVRQLLLVLKNQENTLYVR